MSADQMGFDAKGDPTGDLLTDRIVVRFSHMNPFDLQKPLRFREAQKTLRFGPFSTASLCFTVECVSHPRPQ
jgi:hypothetical protein